MATTIQLMPGTRDRLKAVGRKGETYDAIIQKLLTTAEYVNFMEEQYSILASEKHWTPLKALR